MEKPMKKRGRPPITKDYKNPLESPMAHSSLKVQKLGAQGFSRPMMKVGQFTPSPRNRRTSSSSSAGSNSGTSHMEELASSAPASASKRGRFRGVLLTTPTKKRLNVSTSSTPSSNDSIFQSSSRMTLKSSPPVSSSPLSGMEGKAMQMHHTDTAQLFKFTLTIGDNGRATIAGSSPLSTPTKEGSSPSSKSAGIDVSSTNVTNCENRDTRTYEKKRVLSLLRQMRNGPGSSRNSKQLNNDDPSYAKVPQNTCKEAALQEGPSLRPQVSKSAEKNESQTSPSVYIPKTPQFPSTPRTSFPIRTGLTPNIGIDQVLLDIISTPRAGILTGNDSHIITLSPRARLSKQTGSNKNSQQQQQLEQQQQFVFKFSSADPLLMTDDIEGNWSEVIYNHIPPSPKHQICFNTPPSWINLGSPRAFSPQRRDSNTILISACQSSGSEVAAENRTSVSQPYVNLANSKNCEPSNIQPSSFGTRKGQSGKASTPNLQQFAIPAMIERTPSIQQSMSGILNPKFSSEFTPSGTINSANKDVSKSMSTPFEQEDAIVALKKLITER